jgi:hypothetical protein
MTPLSDLQGNSGARNSSYCINTIRLPKLTLFLFTVILQSRKPTGIMENALLPMPI